MDSNDIKISRAPGWKCQRCWRILPEVGLVPEYPTACLRCVEAVAGTSEEFPVPECLDIHELSCRRFDEKYRSLRDQGMDRAQAIKAAGDYNSGRNLTDDERDHKNG